MKTVAIVGSHTSTRSNVPWDDPAINDIWVFNEAPTTGTRDERGVLHPWAKRVTGVFQMHSPTIYRNPDNKSDPGHWAWLQQDHDYPIWMQDADPLVPASVRYPLEGVLALTYGLTLHGRPVHYLTSTISMAIGLGVYLGYTRILLYGVEMSSDTEYAYQRDCVAFWAGLAAGRGVQVELHCADDVFDRLMYGYASDIDQSPAELAERADTLAARVGVARINASRAGMLWAEACARQEVDAGALETWLNASIELGRLEGQEEQARRYAYKAQRMIDETGRAHIDRTEFEIAYHVERKAAEECSRDVYRTAGRIDLVVQNWIETRNPGLLSAIKRFAEDHVRRGYDSGLHMGKADENTRLMADLDRRILAAGGKKAAELMRV